MDVKHVKAYIFLIDTLLFQRNDIQYVLLSIECIWLQTVAESGKYEVVYLFLIQIKQKHI